MALTSFTRAQLEKLVAAVDGLRARDEKNYYNQSLRIDAISSMLEEVAKMIQRPTSRYPRDPTDIDDSTGHPDARLTSTDVRKLSEIISQALLSSQQLSREQRILASLDFKARTHREAAIAEAHHSSCEWAFRTSFSQWLQNQSGIFWISGKAGSGKSTWMKHIHCHPTTKRLLRNWASPKPAVDASWFFWHAGSQMQKSLQGLLRSLLYDIFRECPSIILDSTLGRWFDLDRISADKKWSMPELLETLRTIGNCKTLPVKFCFFIDGLDEYHGEHIEFCELARDLVELGNIKLCLSSRPWAVFELHLQTRWRENSISMSTRGTTSRYLQKVV